MKTAPVLTVSEYVPYGATKVFLRGGMNGWGEADQFAYDGSSIYSITIPLNAGSYDFKVASSDWSTVNFGAGSDGPNVALATDKTIVTSNDNLKINITDTGSYKFSVNATDTAAPVLNVTKQVPPTN